MELQLETPYSCSPALPPLLGIGVLKEQNCRDAYQDFSFLHIPLVRSDPIAYAWSFYIYGDSQFGYWSKATIAPEYRPKLYFTSFLFSMAFLVADCFPLSPNLSNAKKGKKK